MRCLRCGEELKTGKKYCSRNCANIQNGPKLSKDRKGKYCVGIRPGNYRGAWQNRSGSRKIQYNYINVGVIGKSKYVAEHRLVMEKHIGRKLTKQDVVHHIDGNGLNNDINNLLLTTSSGHRKLHKLL